MTRAELIQKHLDKLKRLNPEGLNHLEEATSRAENLEHVQQIVARAVNVATMGKPITVDNVYSPYVAPHNLSYLIRATRKLVTGDTEVLDAGGNRVALPAPFFALSGFAGGADYKRMLLPYVPSNVAIDSVLPAVDGDALVIGYKDKTTNHVETNTMGMSGSKSYLTLLDGTRTAYMTLTQPKIKIDDVSQAGFFDESVFTLDLSLSGKKTDDDFVPNVFEPAENPNTTMRQIGHEFAIDNEKGFLFMMSPNLKQGQVTQSNGQFWTASLICLSSGWIKTGAHPGL